MGLSEELYVTYAPSMTVSAHGVDSQAQHHGSHYNAVTRSTEQQIPLGISSS